MKRFASIFYNLLYWVNILDCAQNILPQVIAIAMYLPFILLLSNIHLLMRNCTVSLKKREKVEFYLLFDKTVA